MSAIKQVIAAAIATFSCAVVAAGEATKSTWIEVGSTKTSKYEMEVSTLLYVTRDGSTYIQVTGRGAPNGGGLMNFERF